jgi:hypothetical protein
MKLPHVSIDGLMFGMDLLVEGLILATPELMIATLGGLMARWIWGKRWTTT